MTDAFFVVFDFIGRRSFLRAIALVVGAAAPGIKRAVVIQILPCR
ncbi:MAG: twin-arginine translocation signal domain-containing protein [Faecousia sp.]